jgi:hypothetical protein
VYPKIFVAYATQLIDAGDCFAFVMSIDHWFAELLFWQEYLVYIAFVLIAIIIANFGIGMIALWCTRVRLQAHSAVIEKASGLLYVITLTPFFIFSLIGFAVAKFDGMSSFSSVRFHLLVMMMMMMMSE